MPADYLAIASECGILAWDCLTISNLRKINAYFRKHDESVLWPISGQFNVTERAIRRVRKAQHAGLCLEYCASYIETLDEEMSEIVNNTRNW